MNKSISGKMTKENNNAESHAELIRREGKCPFNFFKVSLFAYFGIAPIKSFKLHLFACSFPFCLFF